MESRVLDTDVFSFFFKRDSRSELYQPDVQGQQLCLCFQTVAEVKAWAIERNWGKARRDLLEQVLQRYIVLPYDARMADTWADISAGRRKIGKPIGCGDCWIAAAAIRHDITLVTHNAGDFRNIPNLKIITHAEENSNP